jgi:chromosome segregation ATPase
MPIYHSLLYAKNMHLQIPDARHAQMLIHCCVPINFLVQAMAELQSQVAEQQDQLAELLAELETRKAEAAHKEPKQQQEEQQSTDSEPGDDWWASQEEGRLQASVEEEHTEAPEHAGLGGEGKQLQKTLSLSSDEAYEPNLEQALDEKEQQLQQALTHVLELKDMLGIAQGQLATYKMQAQEQQQQLKVSKRLITQLKQQIGGLEDRNHSLEQEQGEEGARQALGRKLQLVKLQEVVTQYEKEIASYQEQLLVKEQQLQEARDQQQAAEDALQNLQDQQGAAIDAMGERLLKECETQLKEMQEKHRQQVAAVQQQLDSEQPELQQHARQFEALGQEREGLLQQLQQHREQTAAMQEELDGARSQVSHLQGHNRTLQEQLMLIQEQQEQTTGAWEAATQQLQEQLMKASQVQKVLLNQRAGEGVLRAEQQQQQDQQREDVDKERLVVAKEELEQTKAELAALQEAATEQVVEVEQQLQWALERAALLQEENEQLQAQLQQQQQGRVNHSSSSVGMHKLQAEGSGQGVELQQQVLKLQQEKQDLQVKLGEHKLELGDQVQAIRHMAEQLTSMEKAKEQSKEQVGVLQKEKQQLEVQLQDVQRKVKQLEDEVGNLKMEAATKEKLLLQRQAKIEELQAAEKISKKGRRSVSPSPIPRGLGSSQGLEAAAAAGPLAGGAFSGSSGRNSQQSSKLQGMAKEELAMQVQGDTAAGKRLSGVFGNSSDTNPADLHQQLQVLQSVLLKMQGESDVKDQAIMDLLSRLELRTGAGYARTEEVSSLAYTKGHCCSDSPSMKLTASLTSKLVQAKVLHYSDMHSMLLQ